MKTHLHNEQFDGHPHPYCGRGFLVVVEAVFEATDPVLRCKDCERYWFPNGQPEWHLMAAKNRVKETA